MQFPQSKGNGSGFASPEYNIKKKWGKQTAREMIRIRYIQNSRKPRARHQARGIRSTWRGGAPSVLSRRHFITCWNGPRASPDDRITPPYLDSGKKFSEVSISGWICVVSRPGRCPGALTHGLCSECWCTARQFTHGATTSLNNAIAAESAIRLCC
jgi:hypothetical protein